jgi:hypothetical protein
VAGRETDPLGDLPFAQGSKRIVREVLGGLNADDQICSGNLAANVAQKPNGLRRVPQPVELLVALI